MERSEIIRLAVQAGLLNYVDNETPRRYFIAHWAGLDEVLEFANLLKRNQNHARIETP